MKFKFKHSYQISALQLSRQKSQGKCALCAICAPCALLCTTAHLFFQNMVYKKVSEIQIQACIPNFRLSSLADKKARENVHFVQFVHPVHSCAPLHTCFFKIWFIRKFLKFKFKPAYQIFGCLAQQTKSQGKCALCAPCALLCTTAHLFFSKYDV